MLVQTVGWAAGLWVVGIGTRSGAAIAEMTTWLSMGVLVGGLLLLTLPETKRRELETISHDDGAAA
jgi:hypothetical protein